MILDVIFCALWCVGILALVWGLAGWLLLPLSGRQSTVLFPDGKEGALERQLRTNAWLRAAGLERGMVYVVCDGLSSQARQEAELFLMCIVRNLAGHRRERGWHVSWPLLIM